MLSRAPIRDAHLTKCKEEAVILIVAKSMGATARDRPSPLFYISLIIWNVYRTLWMGDYPAIRPLPTQEKQHNKHR
jgi:hypothetical protein